MTLSMADRQTIEGFSDDQESGVAVALDKAVNGTSLMLVVSVGKAQLLFPGDAQWGTWSAALEIPEWQALLKRTAFYKVGHHGSHNATPKAFVETILPNDFAAMASTCHVDQWANIPKAELMSALGAKTKRLVRSDQTTKVKGFLYDEGNCIQILVPY
jgi:beta-lactamase superfamily II metal-dependent hydrolase